MAKKKPMSNSYEDDDFAQVISEIEEMDDEIASIKAASAGKISGVSTRRKNRIKIANQELGIPSDVLRAVLKQRSLERQIKSLVASVPDDLVEVYADAAGQFSFLKPDDDHPTDNAAQVAAREQIAENARRSEAEQEEGTKVIDELAQVH